MKMEGCKLWVCKYYVTQKTRISIGSPLTMDLYYKLIGHYKRVSANLKEMVEKLIRIYPHLSEWGE